MTDYPARGLQLRTLVKAEGVLEMSLVEIDTPVPAADEVVVRIDAAPINPSDLALMVGAADMSTATASGSAERPVLTAQVSASGMRAMAGRLDQSLPAGNEGAGVVIAAGSDPRAQGLIGKTVSVFGGDMFTQYRTLKAATCMVLPDDATAADGASAFVNPLTALSMVETMRMEGHTALVHTAAASNLGQMLNRICLMDGVDLVNIVRSPEQAELLRGIGAKHVVDSTATTFMADLTEALVATGATLAFDAIGGGKLAAQILTCMERAINTTATTYSRYGSSVHKQVYIYGMLDPSPTELNRAFGMIWGVGGWLLTPFLARIGADRAKALRARVATEIRTTFASAYAGELSLAEALKPEVVAVYNKRATGAKYLINPNQDIARASD